MRLRVPAQDMNNDGYGDIAIGHSLADPLSGGNSAGVTYVVFGGGDIQSRLDVLTDLDGSNGFVLEGGSEGDRSGTSVSNAGVRERPRMNVRQAARAKRRGEGRDREAEMEKDEKLERGRNNAPLTWRTMISK